MNLLGILLKLMMSQSSVGSVSGKTGLSEKQIKQLMMIAIPLLLKYLTNNASQGSGASSLLSALAQHTNKNSMDIQLKDADEEDGSRIIGHILGGDQEKVTKDLSAQTGIDPKMIAKVLAILAPALLSGLSAATTTTAAKPQQAQAAPTFSLSDGAGIFGSLLGLGKEEKEEPQPQPQVLSLGGNASGYDGTALLQMLLGAMK